MKSDEPQAISTSEVSESPRVSVIIPTYNRESEIARALDSVRRQTFQAYEVIVCDDASEDNTCEIVRDYQRKDSRVKLHVSTRNRGAASARNVGMAAARGDFIAFLDSDDEWFPTKLAREVDNMEKKPSDVGVSICGAEIICDEDFQRRVYSAPRMSWEKDSYRKYILNKIPFLTPTVFFRRSCLESTGFMAPDMRRNQDCEFLLRLFRFAGLSVLPICLVRVHLTTTAKRGLYDIMKSAAPYREVHAGHLRVEFGRWASARYLANVKMSLSDAAFRERKWKDGCKELLDRMIVFPVILPADIFQISKAIARAILRH